MTRAEHCARMRQGKAEKLAGSPEAGVREVGFAFFCGPVFRGCHTVQLFSVDDGRTVLDLRVDGVLKRPKTERGIRSLIARRIASKVKP